jgi:hypothetical protein
MSAFTDRLYLAWRNAQGKGPAQGTGAARPKCRPPSRNVPFEKAHRGPSAPARGPTVAPVSTLPVLGGKAPLPALAEPSACSCAAPPARLEKPSSAAFE